MKPDRRVIAGIWIFTAIVFAAVILLHELPGADVSPAFVVWQPPLHALLNGTAFLVLISSYFSIRNKNVSLHKRLNTLAMLLSVFFLISYVMYHYFAGDTQYGGNYKALYLFILLTHIVLAGISLPFILLAYYRGFIGDIAAHRRMVSWVFPIWLYVALTGVLVYLFLSPYYAS
jgi:putative membrane protein